MVHSSQEAVVPTAQTGDVSALIKGLESATAGSRALDASIMALFYHWDRRHIGVACWDDYHGTCCADAKHLDWVWSDPLTDCFVTNAVEGFEFTTSMDRCLALAERLGLRPYSADGSVAGRWSWMVVDPACIGDLEANPYVSGSGQTPSLALCVAILKAVQEATASTCGTDDRRSEVSYSTPSPDQPQ